VADFSTRVWAYFELRSKLEKGLPALTVTEDPAQIRSAELALAKKIRVARAGAKQGEIFTPAISVEFRKVLLLEMNANIWATIMDENPGDFSYDINDTYPKEAPQKDLYNLGDFGTLQPWSARRDSASGWRRCCRT